MDEGWTRWVLDDQQVNYTSLSDKRIRAGSLISDFKSIAIPDEAPRIIMNGYARGRMPPEYTGGIGAQGVKSLRDFVEGGGTLICFNRASDFAIEQFKLPLRDVVAGLARTDFYVPGSILRIELDEASQIASGVPQQSIAWAEGSPVFEIAKDASEQEQQRVRVIARYPSQKNPLLSGWLLGAERIKGKAALVEVLMGKGRVILFGFRPQYRGQSLATYPLFFNSVK
jgi:hypothetical protein